MEPLFFIFHLLKRHCMKTNIRKTFIILIVCLSAAVVVYYLCF